MIRYSLAIAAMSLSLAWASQSDAQIVVAPTFYYGPVTPYVAPQYHYGYQYPSYYGRQYTSRRGYYPGYRYPTYRYPQVRATVTPSTSPTWGGAHSSQYFGNPHASQYFPR